MPLLKEPVLHFFLIGCAVFAWFSFLNPGEQRIASQDQIVIDAKDIDRLVKQFSGAWQRMPTAQELSGMQDSLLREEILVREARALGLDQNDLIVRNRLVQKMEFLTTSLSQALEPEEAVLRAHLAQNSDRFALQAEVAFEQVYLGQDATHDDVNAALDALNTGASSERYNTSTLLPTMQPLAPRRQVDGRFGQGFFVALKDLPLRAWGGPVQSGYGIHLVYLLERNAPQLPPFESIKEDVLFDWRRGLTSELTEAQFQTLKAKYDIETLGPAQLADRLSQ